MPPGRGSSCEPVPFHSTSRSGSVKNRHTSSRGAAMLTSCTIVSSRTVTAFSFRLPVTVRRLCRVLEGLEPNLPEPVQELADPHQPRRVGGIQATRADPALG